MKRILISGILVIGALGLAGCSAAPGASDAGAPVPLIESGAKSLDADAAATERQIVVTGSLILTVDDPADTAGLAGEIVEAAGGRVEGRSENGTAEDAGGSAQLTVRIPAEKLNDTVERLRELGEVQEISIDRQDVTSVAQDLEARITALQTSVDRLVDLMSGAATTADLVSIEASLSERQEKLESLQAQKRALDDQVDLATVTLRLQSKEAAPAAVPGDFLGGLTAGWNAFVAFLSGLVVVVGVLLPWLVFLGALTFGVLFLVRWILRRRSKPRGTRADPVP